jgi:hypothetical protein
MILWKIFINIIRWVILFYALMAFAMSVGLAFPFIGVLSLTTIITLIPYRRKIFAFINDIAYKRLSYALPSAVFLMIFLSLFTPILPNPGAEWNNRLAVIEDRVVGISNPHLKLREKVGLYTLGLVMSVSAYPVYPEVAKEQFLFHFPGPPERIWYSDFAMGSELISEPVYDFLRSLPNDAAEGTQRFMEDIFVLFTYGQKDQRVALALHPCHLSGTAVRVAGEWKGSFQAQIPISYFPQDRVLLFTLLDTAVWFEEGLFYAMQNAGWCFPYLATWKWEVNEDDIPLR